MGFFKQNFEKELVQILDWWSNETLDHSNGGFIGRIDYLGNKYPKAEKAIILNSRILWSFSAACNAGYSQYFNLAERSYQYLIQHFLDQEYGGVFWMLDYKGNVLSNRKQVYAQAFSIYALSEFYIATNDSKVLEMAIDIFDLLEKFARDKDKGGYKEAFSRDWSNIEDVRLSEKEGNYIKTMNTHLHVLEAYIRLYSASKKDRVEAALLDLILLYLDKFLDPETGRLKLFFDEHWKEYPDHHSYGHEIESAWLLHEAMEVSGVHTLIDKNLSLIRKMVDRVLKEGFSLNGGILNERQLNGHTQDYRDWWPQAEGVIGFYDLYQKTSEKVYRTKAEECWKFIVEKIKDDKNGEWHWGIDEKDQIRNQDQVGPWKAPYHNSRMCLEMIKRLSV